MATARKRQLTRRCSTQASLAGQFVSRSFVVLLRKSIPQNRNLQTAAELGVMAHAVGKYMESKKAWLYSDAHDEALVAGNREGLEQLSLAIKKALEMYGNRIPTEVETTDVSFVLCIEQEEYFKSDSKPKTLHQIIVKYSLMIWFLLLPFVGLAALIYLIAYSIKNIY